MTRINATIPPASLCDQHLVAEYREILRTTTLATNKPVDKSKLPQTFTLGTGHVKFFYDKLKYIHLRFNSLRQELINRGYDVSIEWDDGRVSGHLSLYNDWYGTSEANQLVIDRIYERALTMKKITLSGKQITADEYKLILVNYEQ
jgi:deoxyribonuclease (pyrimidine dimer)